MAELYIPVRLHVVLENSFRFTPDRRDAQGTLFPQGTSEYRALAAELERRLKLRLPMAAAIQLEGKFTLSSFDLIGFIRITFENADLLLAHYLLLKTLTEDVLRDFAFSIEKAFKEGWRIVFAALGNPTREAPSEERSDGDSSSMVGRIYSRSDIVSEAEQPAEPHSRRLSIEPHTGKNGAEETKPKKHELTWLKWLPQTLLIIGAYGLFFVYDSRTREAESRLRSTLIGTSAPISPSLVPTRNEIVINIPSSLPAEAPSSAPCVSDRSIRVFKNGTEVSCE